MTRCVYLGYVSVHCVWRSFGYANSICNSYQCYLLQLTHPLTHSHTHSLPHHPLTHSLTHSLTHQLTHSPTHPPTYSHLQRVRKVSQSLHYNDPLRRYIDIIIKKFPEDLQKEFSQGHDDYDDFQGGGEDALSKSSLESLLKKTMKAVRLSNSTRM